MENDQKTYRINPVVAVVVILEIVFIIFAIVAVSNILSRNVETPGIKISNYSAIPEGVIIDDNNTKTKVEDIDFALDDTAKKTIENTIYDVVLMNDKGGVANSGAKIREGSAHYAYIEDISAYFLNFIVDIEDLGQSYRFVWFLGGGSPDKENFKNPEVARLMAFCPREDEMIYGDFDCKDAYAGNGSDIVVYELLKYKSFNNFTVGVSGDVYNGEPLNIRINVASDEEQVKDAAVKEVYDYLAALGFDLYNYNFVVGGYICCSLD